MLDAIAGTESGRAGYDAVLGNGRYGTPSKPVSTMTLDEAFAFGRQVRARHGSSSALGRFQIVGSTMRAAQRALGLDGSTAFDAATQDRMAKWIARKQGLGAWEGLKSNPRAMAAARAAMAQGGAQDAPGSREAGVADSARQALVGNGSALPGPFGAEAGQSRRGNMQVTIDVEGQSYGYGSGGNRGASTIPFGTYPITPGTIGPWGRAHGALGINNNAIWDKNLGRMRQGIEFHAASNANRITSGCLGIAREQYGRFREHVLDMYKRHGRAFLTVGRDGRASVTADPPTAEGQSAKANIGDRARETLGGKPGTYGKPQDIGDGMTSTGWKKAGAEDLAAESPAQRLAKSAPKMPQAGGSAGGAKINAPINIMSNGDAQHTANMVQKRIQDASSYHAQDLSYESI